MSDKRINIFELLQNEGKLTKIFIYSSVKVEDDPYEHTKIETFLNPLAINALVQQMTP
jgi:hypothetical protein